MSDTNKTPEWKSGQTKCTPETIATICQAVANGAYPAIASAAAGINPATFYKWMKWGVENGGTEPFRTFMECVNAAQAQAENHLVETVKNASAQQWTAAAWILERSRPERWSKKERVLAPESDESVQLEWREDPDKKADAQENHQV